MSSESWEDLARTYQRYREVPAWSGGKETPNNQGLLPRVIIREMRDRGARAAAEVARALERLRRRPGFPAAPRELEQKHMAEVVRARFSRVALAGLWEALIFDRDDYTCRYCGRSAWAVWQAEGRRRTLRLVVDHVRPRARLGERRSLENTATACGSCAAIKTVLPSDPFLDELRSLATAVSHRYGGRADSVQSGGERPPLLASAQRDHGSARLAGGCASPSLPHAPPPGTVQDDFFTPSRLRGPEG